MVNISSERIYSLHNRLKMGKLCTRAHKRSETWTSRVFGGEFLFDKAQSSWVFSPVDNRRWNTDSTVESTVFRGPKSKNQQVMATVFWELFTNIILKMVGQSLLNIKATYWIDSMLLWSVNALIFEEKKKLFLQDMASAHKDDDEIDGIGLRNLSPSSVFAWFSPCHYYIFSTLKRWLAGKRFHSNIVIVETDAYLEELDSDYKKGIEMLETILVVLSLKEIILKNKVCFSSSSPGFFNRPSICLKC